MNNPVAPEVLKGLTEKVLVATENVLANCPTSLRKQIEVNSFTLRFLAEGAGIPFSEAYQINGLFPAKPS